MSYSQFGEDDIVAKIFDDSTLYPPAHRLMEIGAYHPTTFSNSRLLIERGWEAVLIDASPWAIAALVIEYGSNVEQVQIVSAAVTTGDDKLRSLCLTPDGMSSDDPLIVEKWKDQAGYQGYAHVATVTLEQISLQFGHFDFVSFDTEGSSVDLAKQWLDQKHRPRVFCCEFDDRLDEICTHATAAGYKLVRLTGHTNAIFSL